MLGMLGNGPVANHFVDGLLGGTGLGHQHMGLVDWTPAGALLQANEAGQQIGNGHPWGGVANLALAAVPIPSAAKGAKGLFGAGARAFEGAAGRGAMGATEKVAAPIIAYHGSPHTFDQFDMSKVGTGEGAQSYGHGLYFADNEDVAKSYRDKLGGQVSFNGRPVDFTSPQLGDTALDALGVLHAQGGKVDDALSWMRQSSPLNGHYAPAADWLEKNRAKVSYRPGGAMYQVGISAPPEHFLDWDAPMSGQHPRVRAALDPILDPLAKAYGSGPLATQTVGDTFKRLEGKVGAPEIAQQLSDAGIPGIKYLDAGSRAAGDGSRNYVVFSPENIDILKRYGLPAALGTGALAGAAATPDQAQASPRPAGMFGSMAPPAPQ
jgi:hypothetical protein